MEQDSDVFQSIANGMQKIQAELKGLQSIKTELITHIDAKIKRIEGSLNKIHVSLSTLRDQVSELERRVGTNEDDLQDLTQRLKMLEKDNAYLKQRVDDAENRSRASSLRFIHVTENAEGNDILGFIKHLIVQLFGQTNFPTPPSIERAHRFPTFTNQSFKASPRPILVKFSHFQDKLKILRLSREKRELLFNGSRVHIFPDFSASLVQKRREFDLHKKKLLAMDFKYSLLFPCTLKVIHEGKTRLFRSPDEVVEVI